MRGAELFLELDVDLVQRLNVVGGEGNRDDHGTWGLGVVDLVHQFFGDGSSLSSKPWFRTDLGLPDESVWVREVQFLHHSINGGCHLGRIRVSSVDDLHRQRVSTEQQHNLVSDLLRELGQGILDMVGKGGGETVVFWPSVDDRPLDLSIRVDSLGNTVQVVDGRARVVGLGDGRRSAHVHEHDGCSLCRGSGLGGRLEPHKLSDKIRSQHWKEIIRINFAKSGQFIYLMSFDISWESISHDANINSQLLHFLNDKLASIELPNYLNGLEVVKFSLGEKSPELTIRDIDQPFEEFYADLQQPTPVQLTPIPRTPLKPQTRPQLEISRSPSPASVLMGGLSSPVGTPRGSLLLPRTNSYGLGLGGFGLREIHEETELAPLPDPSPVPEPEPQKLDPRRSDNDIQLTLDLKFDSSIYIEVVCNLLINYPTQEFIKLPVRLKITDLFIHSLAVVAYIQKHVFISFLCDIDDDENAADSEEMRQDSRKSSVSETTPTVLSSRDRIDIIRNLRIEGELGNHHSPPTAHQGSILRNIGKIEKFLVGTIRNILIEELAWPSWIELDMNEEEDSETDIDD
ncbi:hypothetical protein OGAPHI_003721 [Ogataea philodendri]|uniref:Mitochondrial distribution and morphology protein 12 n=1 Tax=Ogataea philodendri TaxID=1378263 RepID=A0A9P8P5D4_9ASCO|nr:uncharacterized protein OGAPHI_003721 [Ogataea philodendri]KAH3665535.1 hypothetical protein OGAPHI_003721 [Ogataea philodendri]